MSGADIAPAPEQSQREVIGFQYGVTVGYSSTLGEYWIAGDALGKKRTVICRATPSVDTDGRTIPSIAELLRDGTDAVCAPAACAFVMEAVARHNLAP